jgi:eukaryotic-like serine/threonine-protein kinase
MVIPGAAPARLGRYELLARLATGGMGEIFLARLEGAEGFEKLFVVKRILPHLADDPRFRAMLIAEARIASMMTHANVCHVYELGETDGQLYIVMEYLDGITVLPLLRKVSKAAGELDLGLVGGVIQQATDGLHYAHELKDRSGEYLGIVHRDVTPTNLFLTNSGVVKVLDFGIAKVKDASAHTQTGTVKGKYAYMSPEQLRGASVDRRADVFALGVVLYEMLALRRLFQRKTDYLTFRAVMEQPIADIRQYRRDCPEPLVIALSRALDRDPANRFDSARQFGTAVLDAITTIERPWTQGELSDYVSSNFAGEIERRTALLASAARPPGASHAVPVIATPDDHPDDDDDGRGGFAAVDTVGAATTTDRLRQAGGEVPRLLAPGSPRVDSLRMAALPPSGPPPIVVIDHKRSLVWPLVALAMVAVASGALLLVWRQAQKQVVVSAAPGGQVTATDAGRLVAGPAVIDAGQPPAGSAGLELPAPRDAAPAPRQDPAAAPRQYRDVVRSKATEANRCAVDHGNPPVGTELVILVAPDGRPRSVTITPASVDATLLGRCIKGVFSGASFPRGAQDYTLTVNLKPRV